MISTVGKYNYVVLGWIPLKNREKVIFYRRANLHSSDSGMLPHAANMMDSEKRGTSSSIGKADVSFTNREAENCCQPPFANTHLVEALLNRWLLTSHSNNGANAKINSKVYCRKRSDGSTDICADHHSRRIRKNRQNT